MSRDKDKSIEPRSSDYSDDRKSGMWCKTDKKRSSSDPYVWTWLFIIVESVVEVMSAVVGDDWYSYLLNSPGCTTTMENIIRINEVIWHYTWRNLKSFYDWWFNEKSQQEQCKRLLLNWQFPHPFSPALWVETNLRPGKPVISVMASSNHRIWEGFSNYSLCSSISCRNLGQFTAQEKKTFTRWSLDPVKGSVEI
jgi:hypothetical protein